MVCVFGRQIVDPWYKEVGACLHRVAADQDKEVVVVAVNDFANFSQVCLAPWYQMVEKEKAE